jgi:hypothetical protein
VKVCGWALLMSTLPSSFSYKLIAKKLFEEGREKLVNRKFVFCLVVGLAVSTLFNRRSGNSCRVNKYY